MRHGFLLIDKLSGFTSHDVVAKVRHSLSERSIGHLGTLDPLATGLLVLAVGKKALKVVELFGNLSKEYEAEVTFGSTSTTYDAEGRIEAVDVKPGWTEPMREGIERMLRDRFTGKISQVPPAYSAVHIGGERAYRKAMQGRSVEIPARTVDIDKCEVLSYEYPILKLRIRCGSGTYIRSLAHDLGQSLRFGAYLSALRRVRVGEWSIDSALMIEKATWASVIPLKDALKDLHGVELSSEEFEELTFGRNIARSVRANTIGWFDELPVALLTPAGYGEAHARKVF